MSTHQATCVLLVEDHQDTQMLMRRLLAGNGYSVRVASGYAEALEVFHRERCNVLVSDIELTDGSGLALMQELKPQGVVGIAVSGLVTRDDRAASLAAGFHAHLCKPIQFDQLLAALRSLPPTKVA